MVPAAVPADCTIADWPPIVIETGRTGVGDWPLLICVPPATAGSISPSPVAVSWIVVPTAAGLSAEFHGPSAFSPDACPGPCPLPVNTAGAETVTSTAHGADCPALRPAA